ncbi:hypothetical protein IU450_28595 [Nocardia abscessus]|uniref:hypothetical protein n=1 Tax=Nocardia abscessus TaxID=120957 RepID=UPI001894DDE6|nr:hypothetical protein [Nocardia abscessus]MBF6339820.1 hypothetical protein [Nocardia abscessus]
MTYHPNLATILIRLRDVDGHAVIASTDGHHVRLLLRDRDDPVTDWRYADLSPNAADILATTLATRSRPAPIRRAARWRRLRRDRR